MVCEKLLERVVYAKVLFQLNCDNLNVLMWLLYTQLNRNGDMLVAK